MRSSDSFLPGFVLFAIGCVPRVTYSAAVRDPREVALLVQDSSGDQDEVVLPPNGPAASRVIRSEELPLNHEPTIVEAKRDDSGALQVNVRGCPREEYDARLQLVTPSGRLIETERPPVVEPERGVLLWPHEATYYKRPPVQCAYKGVLESPVTNVRWMRKTTSGHEGAGALGIVVGALMAGGGGILVGIGAENKQAVPIAMGAPIVGLGLFALGLGIYHVTYRTRSEPFAASFPMRDEGPAPEPTPSPSHDGP